MFQFSTAETALRTAQTGLDVVANNIANANTPGYHRQVVRQVDRLPIERDGLHIGNGVKVQRIDRILHRVTEEAMTNNVSETADVEAQVDVLRRIEALVAPSSGSLQDRLRVFMDGVHQLSSRPSETGLREIVLQDATAVLNEIQTIGDSLGLLNREVNATIAETVETINSLANSISELNQQIAVAEARKLYPNDLNDKRDALINELAQLVDVRRNDRGEGPPSVMFGGTGFIGHGVTELEVTTSADGQIVVSKINGSELSPSSGKLTGLLTLSNQTLPSYQSRLEEFALAFAREFNAVHSTGLGLSGPYEVLTSEIPVDDVAVPLSEVLSDSYNVQAGDVFVSITDGIQTTLHRIGLNPTAQSLNDVAAAISAIDHIQAVVNPSNGTMSILAESGYHFDFTGRPQTVPDGTNITGDAVVQVTGQPQGTENERLTFRVAGSGTIGVTPDLKLNVLDQSGGLVKTLDVGLGYETSGSLDVGNGISITVASGILNDGDEFFVDIVPQRDSTGLLSALGVNAMFVGTGTRMQVSQRLLDDPIQFATSATGESGSNSNLLAMVALRDASVLADQTQSLESYLGDLIVSAGTELNVTNELHDYLQQIGQNLEHERQSISGVDPNEELIRMLQYQRSFEIASRYIATVDEMLADLLAVIR